MLRAPRARSTSSSGFRLSAEITPRFAPCTRRWRVRARVSISLIPTTAASSRYRSRLPAERQDEATAEISRTTNPATWSREDSTSSPFTP